MRTIKILNKNTFNQMMIDNNINSDTISTEKSYFISINDTEGPKSTSFFQDVESDNLLKLYFDDTVGDVDLEGIEYSTNINIKKLKKRQLKEMTEEQGKEIISFIQMIKDNNTDYNLIIHCTAGQNRSGSIGKFAADFLETGQKQLLLDNPYIKGNSVVTRILNKLWLWSHYDKD